MVFFQSSEEKIRNASSEAYFSAAEELLNDPVVEAAISGTNNIYLDILKNQLYVPNVRHGEIKKPKKVADDGVAFVSLYPGEQLSVNDPTIVEYTPTQYEIIDEYLESLGYEETRAMAMNKIKEFSTKKIGSLHFNERVADAAVKSNAIAITIPEAKTGLIHEHIFTRRPIMKFKVHEAATPRFGTLALHELVHVDQILHDVIHDADFDSFDKQTFGDELEAYHVEAVASQALYRYSSNPKFRNNEAAFGTTCFSVEQARLQENQDKQDQFEPSESLRNLIIKNVGYDIA